MNTSPIVRLPANEAGRDFVVGDIHGCTDMLFNLLKRVRFDVSVDRLFSTGDLIDRGPNHLEALRLLYEPWFYSVLGNHEAMMQSYLGIAEWTSHDANDFIRNGGAWAVEVRVDPVLRNELSDILLRIPVVIEVGSGTEGFRVAHADLPRLPLDHREADARVSTQREMILWSRNTAYSGKDQIIEDAPPAGGYTDVGRHDRDEPLVFCGHTVMPWPMYYRNHMFIDTGAFLEYWPDREGALTLVEPARLIRSLDNPGEAPESNGIYQVRRKQETARRGLVGSLW